MTDQPEVVASADLTPESPKPTKPVSLSSPVVTALQDQADTITTMSLSPPNLNGISVSTAVELPEGNSEQQGSAAAISTPEAEFEGFQNNDDDIFNESKGDNQNNDTQGSQVESEADGDDYVKNFDSPAAAAVVGDDQQDNETSNSNDTSNTLKTHSAVDVSDNAPSSNAAQSLTEPVLKEPDAPKPQDQTTPTAESHQAVSTEGISEAVRPTDGPTDAIDIQALVDKITASAAASDSSQAHIAVASENGVNTNLPTTTQSSTLPPRPPTSQQSAPGYEDLRKYQPGASLPNMPSSLSVVPPGPTAPFPYAAAGTVASELPSNLPPHPPALNANPMMVNQMPQFNYPNHVPVADSSQQSFDTQQRFDTFIQEERKYVSEAKWDRFPEGSRLFIGNLSSERVSKREVFDIFSKFGRLAQISLKAAYGFVQYHDVLEGQAAMDNAQGMEVKGRKIHLEFSRPQKKENDGNRNRGNRGRDAVQHNDRERYDGRRRDDYRARSPSPRGHHQRQGSYGRDRGGHWQQPYDRHRGGGRSRSPPQYSGEYRRRSPEPYYRGPPMSEADLDIPRRYPGAVPDVQLLLLQEVARDFVDWVQRQFVDRGHKVDVMFLNPRFPRELVIQRQIVEGVHAVSELDYRTQQAGKIPLQVFDRSAGQHNARFDQYQDLDPSIAAELVTRAKSQAQFQPPPTYGHGQFPPPSYQPPIQSHQTYPSQPAPHNGMPGVGNLGSIDNSAVQQARSVWQAPPSAPPNVNPDVNAILANLAANSGAAPSAGPQYSSYAPYFAQNGGPQPPPADGSSNPADAQHVQNIMAQLARYK
ncbi:uncharacterized protein BCR38DRAFT_413194 [Pseudomassariella vexata]|uniref:RRM domain-containing protein n=1 Tax=Pseudomassariella vexata TaxID=1141098 RepID=A0A1Y2DI20_9PEZI|nr:uncharacterized protein BCR38DRAFT_413194 [Pseudomassariella vexata]ORY58879.1 hypothetical protein BCR38DRAFT_413194 [Pseudomassariella vexata]